MERLCDPLKKEPQASSLNTFIKVKWVHKAYKGAQAPAQSALTQLPSH